MWNAQDVAGGGEPLILGPELASVSTVSPPAIVVSWAGPGPGPPLIIVIWTPTGHTASVSGKFFPRRNKRFENDKLQTRQIVDCR